MFTSDRNEFGAWRIPRCFGAILPVLAVFSHAIGMSLDIVGAAPSFDGLRVTTKTVTTLKWSDSRRPPLIDERTTVDEYQAALWLHSEETKVTISPDDSPQASIVRVSYQFQSDQALQIATSEGAPPMQVSRFLDPSRIDELRRKLGTNAASGRFLDGYAPGQGGKHVLALIRDANPSTEIIVESNGEKHERLRASTRYGDFSADLDLGRDKALVAWTKICSADHFFDDQRLGEIQYPAGRVREMRLHAVIELEQHDGRWRPVRGTLLDRVESDDGATMIRESTATRQYETLSKPLLSDFNSIPDGTRVIDSPYSPIQYEWREGAVRLFVPTTQIAALDEAIRNVPTATAPPQGNRYDWKTATVLATLTVLFAITSAVLFRKGQRKTQK
jgi:hypothetical protein